MQGPPLRCGSFALQHQPAKAHFNGSQRMRKGFSKYCFIVLYMRTSLVLSNYQYDISTM